MNSANRLQKNKRLTQCSLFRGLPAAVRERSPRSSVDLGPVYRRSEKFKLRPKSHRKNSNVMTSELFYVHILNMKRGSLHTRSFRLIHLSVFKYRLTKHSFAGSKTFRGFRGTGPRHDKAAKIKPREFSCHATLLRHILIFFSHLHITKICYYNPFQ